jgi:hypothetical protein
MGIESVIDGVRRIVHKWVNTASPITVNISRGDTSISVLNDLRFEEGDQLMLKNSTIYEEGLVVKSVDRDTHIITLYDPVLNNWTVDENTILIKAIHNNIIQGIYIGNPDVIPRLPAITINGTSSSSEWFTLESSKERYELEIAIFIQASTNEDGYRFLMKVADTVQKGLKRNIMPLIDDYEIVSLREDIIAGATTIKVNDRDKVDSYRHIILEDSYSSQECWAYYLYPEDDYSVQLDHPSLFNFSAADTSVILPKRFIYNSWPSNIDFVTVHKGDLLKAATIKWFAEEQEIQFLRRSELKLH